MGKYGKKLFYIVAFALCILSLQCAAIAEPPDAGYKLVWEELFNDPVLYHKNWTFRMPGWRREGYLNSTDMVVNDFQNGALIIKTQFGNPPKAGMVSTYGKRWFSPGYFEVKVTLPRHPGHHIAFWLKSDNYDQGGPSSTHGAEIDVVEYVPLMPKMAHFNIHTFGYGIFHRVNGHRVADIVCPGCTHIVGFDWRSDRYTFYIDGKVVWRTAESITSKPHYVILSSHVSGWGGYPRLGKDSDEVRFHYVRYYQDQTAQRPK